MATFEKQLTLSTWIIYRQPCYAQAVAYLERTGNILFFVSNLQFVFATCWVGLEGHQAWPTLLPGSGGESSAVPGAAAPRGEQTAGEQNVSNTSRLEIMKCNRIKLGGEAREAQHFVLHSLYSGVVFFLRGYVAIKQKVMSSN